MRIEIARISLEGLELSDSIPAQTLDLETELIHFNGPLNIHAHVTKITNAITVDVHVEAQISCPCSRCLEPIEIDFSKDFELHYSIEAQQISIDLDPDIREEIILNYPLRPLCDDSCKGMCLSCGKNLNQGGCTCGST